MERIIWFILFLLLLLGFILLLFKVFNKKEKYRKFVKYYWMLLGLSYITAISLIDFLVPAFQISNQMGILICFKIVIFICILKLLVYLYRKFPNHIKQLGFIGCVVLSISILLLIFSGKQFDLIGIIKVVTFLYLIQLIFKSSLRINKEAKYYLNGTYEQIKKIDDDMGGFIYNVEVFSILGKMIKSFTITEREYILYTKKRKFYIYGSVVNLLSLILLGCFTLIIFFILALI